MKNLERELQVMRKIKHKNIVEFYGVEMTVTHFYLAFELCQGGDF